MGVDATSNSSTTGSAWEFPIMAKYRFHAPVARPYVGAGIAFDTLSGLTQTITQTVIPTRITSITSSSNPL